MFEAPLTPYRPLKMSEDGELELRLRELEDQFTQQKTAEKENRMINTYEKRMRELEKKVNETDSPEPKLKIYETSPAKSSQISDVSVLSKKIHQLEKQRQ